MATTEVKTIISMRSIAHTARFVPREPILRYQIPFSPNIKGMDLLEKFTPPKFTLYDGKSDPISHVSNVK